jgi:5-hydroxyisourate hydrolase
MAGLTTHVLDTVSGMPGAGMRIDFSVLEGDRYRLVKTMYANKEGRTDQPVLTPEATVVGKYELLFYVEEYFSKLGAKLPDPPFIDKVPVRFAIFDAKQHYHVPMLATPWSCTTYREHKHVVCRKWGLFSADSLLN